MMASEGERALVPAGRPRLRRDSGRRSRAARFLAAAALSLLAFPSAAATPRFLPHHGVYLPFPATWMTLDAPRHELIATRVEGESTRIATVSYEGEMTHELRLPAPVTSITVEDGTLYALMRRGDANAIAEIALPSLDERSRIDLSPRVVGLNLIVTQDKFWFVDCEGRDFHTHLVSLDRSNGLYLDHQLDVGFCPELHVARSHPQTLIAYDYPRKISEIDISGVLPTVTAQIDVEDPDSWYEFDGLASRVLPSQNGESIYVGVNDEVRVYDGATLELVDRYPAGFGALTMSPDGRQLAVNDGSRVTIYDVRDGTRVARYGDEDDPYSGWAAVEFRPGSKTPTRQLFGLESVSSYRATSRTVFVTIEPAKMVLEMRHAYKHRGDRYWFRDRVSPILLAHVEPTHRRESIVLQIAYRVHRRWKKLGRQDFKLRENGKAGIYVPAAYTRPGNAFRFRTKWPGDAAHASDWSDYKYAYITK